MSVITGGALRAVENVTFGSGARARVVGSAATEYRSNLHIIASMAPMPSPPAEEGRVTQAPLELTGETALDPRGPQTLGDFVKLYASPDGAGGINDYANADTFTALASEWDANQLKTAVSRLVHSFWTYRGLYAVREESRKALRAFEGENPGRATGSNLSRLARATHEAWLQKQKKEFYYTPYTQAVHDLITSALERSYIPGQTLSVHTNPGKKFKLEAANFTFPSDGSKTAFAAEFQVATGRSFESGFTINTVGGEWETLTVIRVGQDGDEAQVRWAAGRSSYLFNLQADNVAAVLYGLSDTTIMKSLGEGSVADRLQSLVEMLRIVNVAWRVNNPWGGINSPLIGKAFALAEDDGIGIRDILLDAVTLRAALEVLEEGRKVDTINLPEPIAAGLENAFGSGLTEVLDLMVDEEALAAAVRINTAIYRGQEAVFVQPATGTNG